MREKKLEEENRILKRHVQILAQKGTSFDKVLLTKKYREENEGEIKDQLWTDEDMKDCWESSRREYDAGNIGIDFEHYLKQKHETN